MYQTGQRVVCIDDKFDAWVYDLYKSLPQEGKVYTVRAVRAGRSNPKFALDSEARLVMTAAEFDILILLNEINNPNDPHSSIEQELGFRAERFAPLQEDLEENKEVEFVGMEKEMQEF